MKFFKTILWIARLLMLIAAVLFSVTMFAGNKTAKLQEELADDHDIEEDVLRLAKPVRPLRNGRAVAAQDEEKDNGDENRKAVLYYCSLEVAVDDAIRDRTIDDPIDRAGNTLLHVTAAHDFVYLVGKLVNNGALKTIKNKRGQTPFNVVPAWSASRAYLVNLIRN